ncbi:MAG: hypothetical protein V4515_04570 [Chloroflexota bacterium]
MTFSLSALFDAVSSRMRATVDAEGFTEYEPDTAPAGQRLSVAVWLGSIRPVRGGNGLDRTTIRVEFIIRLYYPAGIKSQEKADRVLAGAVDALGDTISGAFTLGNTVMNVDLLGQYGDGFGGSGGYSEVDGAEYRVFTLNLPLIVSDVWVQSA